MKHFNISLRRLYVLPVMCGAILRALVATPAHAAEAVSEPADGDVEQPAIMFRKGLDEYDARRYRNAIDFFSRAYEKTHAAAILFNIAQARRLLGECADAVKMYEAFILEDPTSPDVARARVWRDKLSPCNERAGAGPVKAAEAGVAMAEPVPPLVRSPEALPNPALPPRSALPSRRRPLVVGILGGAAVALAGVGGYAAWRANDLSEQTSVLFHTGGTWTGDAAAVEREGERAQTEAIVLLSAAVIAALAAYVINAGVSAPAAVNAR